MGANISEDTAALIFRMAEYDFTQATTKLYILLDYGQSYPRDLCELVYEGWNFNSGNYLFTTDTK